MSCRSASQPTVAINSPPSETQVVSGQEVSIQSTATDAKGITRIDLLVDGDIVRSDKAPSPQTSFSVVQVWQAGAPGKHTVGVLAYNMDNVASNMAEISLEVQAGPGPAPTVTPTLAPTTAPTDAPTAAPTTAPASPTPTPVPIACVNGAVFIADGTIPDGSVLQPNQAFNKVWRLQNSGTCEWGGGYNFVFVNGDAMSNDTAVAAPDTIPGGMADLSVPMTAPAVPGQYTGVWQMRAADGSFFGDQVNVKISVPAPNPPGCSGAPQISSFAASATIVQKGDTVVLQWGPVSNADRAEITPGIGGIGTPGEVQIHIKKTTTYTLKAYCGDTQTTRDVTITVSSPSEPTPTPLPAPTNTPVPPPAPTDTPVPQPSYRTAAGTWISGQFTLELDQVAGCAGPECGVQGRLIVSTSGSPVIDDVEGTINVNTGEISLMLARPGAQGGFTGTVDADSNTMSGQLADVGAITFTRQ
ncbi:MAG: hypothetical protein JW953_21310 [Anaerolineae bacterium]|nr:hypothetical protein [Anaerolineae bacterium]